ncbi:MAG: phosphoribosylformylglycinamidine cyclo-ligase, partial [Chloroflexota bacterium]
MTGLTYKASGVDPSRAQSSLAQLRERIARTKRPEVIGDLGAFGGLFASPGTDMVLVATTDGVGTKLDLARILDRHEVVGTDLVHHCVNDAMAMGAEPLFFLDYFATSRLDPAVFGRVVGAMADACAAHGCALLGGETAEMPGMYGAGSYDLAGFLVGAVRRDAILDPKNVRAGDACIGLLSSGLHTNGYTLARAIVARAAAAQGKDILAVLQTGRLDLGGGSLGDALLRPHASYLEAFKRIRSVAPLRSIAHLPGGGWEGNLPRALADGLGA